MIVSSCCAITFYMFDIILGVLGNKFLGDSSNLFVTCLKVLAVCSHAEVLG